MRLHYNGVRWVTEVPGTSLDIGDYELAMIREYYRAGGAPVPMIKHLRTRHELGLQEAKDLWDSVKES